MKALVIVPCFNEETRLRQAEFLAFLQQQEQSDLLFVDDGSRDKTASVLDLMGQKSPRIHALKLPRNLGKAGAVRAGVLWAKENTVYSHLAFWDADLSTPLVDVIDMLHFFENHPQLEMIFGIRLSKLGTPVERLWIRHYLGRIFATAVSNMLNVPVYDTQCGAKMFRRELSETLFGAKFVSKWFFDVELLWRYRLKKNGLDGVLELPVSRWKHEAGSKLKLRDFIRTPVELWRIRNFYRRR